MVAMIMARQKSQEQKGKSRPPQHKTFQFEYKHPRKFLNQILYESNGQEKLFDTWKNGQQSLARMTRHVYR